MSKQADREAQNREDLEFVKKYLQTEKHFLLISNIAQQYQVTIQKMLALGLNETAPIVFPQIQDDAAQRDALAEAFHALRYSKDFIHKFSFALLQSAERQYQRTYSVTRLRE